MTSTTTLDEARKRIGYYRTQSTVMRDHHHAMDCRDCEDFLQIGIEAFEWLMRADRVIRHAVAHELVAYDPDIEEAVEALAEAWLWPCRKADAWIKRVQTNGHSIDNLEQFRECESEIRAIVAHMKEDPLTAPMAALRDAALEEHRNGETTEFLQGCE